MTYAKGTTVTVEKSKAELDRLLGKFGATQRAIGSDDHARKGFAAFVINGLKVRIVVPLSEPPPSPQRVWMSALDKARKLKKHEQLNRERWRAMVLLVKAKLELVQLQLSTVEREFLADTILPDGRTGLDAVLALRAAIDGAPHLLGPGTKETR